METKPQIVFTFTTQEGKVSIDEWLNELDPGMRGQIVKRIGRLRLGDFGDSKYLEDGIYELRIHKGPGYRIYYGKDGNTIVILLTGGDKSSQLRDIKKAKEYWNEYKERKSSDSPV